MASAFDSAQNICENGMVMLSSLRRGSTSFCLRLMTNGVVHDAGLSMMGSICASKALSPSAVDWELTESLSESPFLKEDRRVAIVDKD